MYRIYLKHDLIGFAPVVYDNRQEKELIRKFFEELTGVMPLVVREITNRINYFNTI